MSFPQLPFGGLKSRRLIFLTSDIPLGAIASNARIGRVIELTSEVPLGAIGSEAIVQRVIELTSEVPLGAIGSDAIVQRVIDLTSDVPLGAIGSDAIAEKTSTTLWTFADIATKLWLDASDSSTTTVVSSAISQWNDKSGNNRHSVQSVPDSRPTVATAALNGLNGIQFDGVNDFLEIVGYAACNNPSSDTFILVVSESSGVARRGIMGIRPVTVSTGWFLSYISGTANPAVIYTGIAAAAATGSVRSADINGFRKTSTTAQIVSFLNTVSSPTPMTLNPVTSGLTTLIGREEVGQSGESMLGRIYEIVEVDSDDLVIFQKSVGYLAHKWGLTANLPSDHPYKTNPPTV